MSHKRAQAPGGRVYVSVCTAKSWVLGASCVRRAAAAGVKYARRGVSSSFALCVNVSTYVTAVVAFQLHPDVHPSCHGRRNGAVVVMVVVAVAVARVKSTPAPAPARVGGRRPARRGGLVAARNFRWHPSAACCRGGVCEGDTLVASCCVIFRGGGGTFYASWIQLCARERASTLSLAKKGAGRVWMALFCRCRCPSPSSRSVVAGRERATGSPTFGRPP